MKKLAIPVIFLFGFSISAFTLYDITYPRKSTSKSELLDYHVPSVYPTIQSALNAAVDEGGNNIAIFVEEGEYRKEVIATGLISENHITSYKAVDYHPQQKTIFGSDLWPASFQYTERK